MEENKSTYLAQRFAALVDRLEVIARNPHIAVAVDDKREMAMKQLQKLAATNSKRSLPAASRSSLDSDEPDHIGTLVRVPC